MSGQVEHRDRTLELLTEALDRTLSRSEQQELQTLLIADATIQGDDLELAAAAAFVAYHEDFEAIPAALALKVEDAAGAFLPKVKTAVVDTVIDDTFISASAPLDAAAGLREEPTPDNVVELSRPTNFEDPRLREAALHGMTVTELDKPKARGGMMLYAGWVLAVLGIATAVGLLRVGVQPAAVIEDAAPPAADEKVSALSLRPNAITRSWSPAPQAKPGVRGKVVWHQETNEGYVSLRGLTFNDPSVEQYQLWIYDAAREAHPVDGGVFDANDAHTVVPIDAKLRISKATEFEVTLERPGGVVVSKRDRLIVTTRAAE